MPSIGNKVVLITGASSCIGEGTARVLASMAPASCSALDGQTA